MESELAEWYLLAHEPINGSGTLKFDQNWLCSKYFYQTSDSINGVCFDGCVKARLFLCFELYSMNLKT